MCLPAFTGVLSNGMWRENYNTGQVHHSFFFIHRPNTSKIFPSRENKNLSTYQTDFNDKNVRKAGAIRAGSAFGNKRNNPHPSEVRSREFIIFFRINKGDSFATRLTCYLALIFNLKNKM